MAALLGEKCGRGVSHLSERRWCSIEMPSAATRLSAMPEPICPSPINATFISISQTPKAPTGKPTGKGRNRRRTNGHGKGIASHKQTGWGIVTERSRATSGTSPIHAGDTGVALMRRPDRQRARRGRFGPAQHGRPWCGDRGSRRRFATGRELACR